MAKQVTGMARTDEQVASILLDLYNTEFGGKEKQRFLISWADIRTLYGFGRLTMSRFARLDEAALRKRLYLLDLGEGENGHVVAVVKTRTADRWRRVPKRIIDQYRLPPDDDTEGEEEDAD
jgi:hypothetical protein